jgi:hypothetical protein
MNPSNRGSDEPAAPDNDPMALPGVPGGRPEDDSLVAGQARPAGSNTKTSRPNSDRTNRLYPIQGPDPLDRSTHGHRQLLGWLGILLPLICLVWSAVFPTTVRLSSSEVITPTLKSVSAYYYTSAVWAFVGILVGMALFLFTYKGSPAPRAPPLLEWLCSRRTHRTGFCKLRGGAVGWEWHT